MTSYLPSASRNFGSEPLPHDERYEMAEEFMSVMYKLWEGSWDDDAVELDRERGVYVNPDKVHPIRHQGRYFDVDGFNMAEPSPQKTPVIFQAGASSRGRAFAAEHGEGLFVNVLNSDLSRVITKDIRDQVEAAGRKRDDVKIYTILTAVVADSDAEAERRYKKYQEYASPEGAMALFGGFSGVDLARFDRDSPLAAGDTNAIQTVLDLFTKLDPTRKWTPADIGNHMSIGGVEPVLVGSAETVANEIERWIDEGDLDGINLSYAVTPYDIEAFVDTVVPELQKRGRVWKDYEGETLREYIAGWGTSDCPPPIPARERREPMCTRVERRTGRHARDTASAVRQARRCQIEANCSSHFPLGRIWSGRRSASRRCLSRSGSFADERPRAWERSTSWT